MTATQPPAPAEHPAAGVGPTPEQAAWIRANAWTPAMRHRRAILPGDKCLCQYGPSHMCAHREHDRCDIGAMRNWHSLIRLPDDAPAQFPEPYRHPTESDYGPTYERAAFVWLADRVCRWVCPCDCHTAPAVPKPTQDALFEVTA